MISVSSDYKTATEVPATSWYAYLNDYPGEVYADEITESDDLKSLKISAESAILCTVMRQAEVVYFGTHDYLDKYVHLGIGIELADTSVEYIDYGSFKVVRAETNQGVEGTKILLYDKMYEALQLYDLDPIYDLVAPFSISELLQAICTRLSWTLATGSDTFPNSTAELQSDPVSELGLTFREVLDMIAEAAGSIIYFDVNDELVVKQVAHDTPLETINADILTSFVVQPKFGEINSVVLSRYPAEDNIVDKDQTSIDANGLTEIKIKNNWLLDEDRETYAQPILDELLGLEFYPFTAETTGTGYFQIGDRVTIEDQNSNTFETVIFGITLNLTGGLKETLITRTPDKHSTNYQTAGIIGQRIKNTEIIVDKQAGVITLINEGVDNSIAELTLTTNTISSQVSNLSGDVQDLQGDVTTLEQTVDGLSVQVQGIGGTNLIRNSAGLKGSIEEWQILDEDGDPVDARNDGTIVQTTEVINNTESGSGIQIDDQFIEQTFATITGETYTLYLRFKKTGDCDIDITGVGTIELTIPGYSDGTWAIFTYSFIAADSSTTLRFENSSGQTALISDVVVKLGEVTGWVQAPNEVYGANYKFDRDGFEVISLTDTFKAVLNSTQLAIIDTAGGGERIVMLVSKDSGTITDLIVQTSLTVQRYENSESALKIVPVSTGAVLVIND